MATNFLGLVGARDYMRRAANPKFLEILLQEHLDIISIPIQGTCDYFQLPKNHNKNRYPDYPSWDVSRVVLNSKNGSDYINANNMAGFDGRCKFIATQEPMTTTLDDFWTMIWQENSRIIVMLNGTKQNSHPTHPQYFCVDKDHTILREFLIKEERIKMESHYTYTSLTIVHMPTGEIRKIHHFKYLDWLETGVPDVRLFLDFLITVNKQDQYYLKQALLSNQLLPGPIVVHSDAGIGRTAAYCIADMCLYQLIHTASVSVPLMVLTVRQQRRFSISTSYHYIFINYVILYFLTNIKLNSTMFFEFRSHLYMKDMHLLLLDVRK